MPLLNRFFILLFFFLATSAKMYASTVCNFGDSTLHSILSFPDKLFGAIDKKSATYQQKLQEQTVKYLHKLERQEKKLQRKLARTDSTAAKNVFGNIDSTYAALGKSMSEPASKTNAVQNVYNGHLDSMQTALKFLDQNRMFGNGSQIPGQLQNAFGSYNELQNKLNGAANVQQYLELRQQYLTSQLKQYTLDKYLAPFKKQVYYYRAQVEEYTNLLNNPDKLEAKLLATLRMLPTFQSFFNKHSELASLFRLPGNDISEQEILGMQTRASVMQELEQRLGGPGTAQQAVQQGMEQGQGELQSLQNRLNNLTSGSMGSGDASMPNFSPNPQKTKSLLQRIELGTNLQSAKPNGFFPITTDIGLSAGYKITNNKVVGIGLSYKIGWGQDIKHIDVTSQGLGLRSYLDIKLKGSIWISGGFEYNYMQAFKDLQTLHKNVDVWQESALIGITKKTKIGKTSSNVQLLYDALWKQQVPNAQPLKFRIGYSLK
ncbi:hypothetical protein QEG73_00960 [Chitinophagaceae bacterium 26-R-25]|nr:hypothetical protein [Chitinophagaceae bacterium 26-R-25]